MINAFYLQKDCPNVPWEGGWIDLCIRFGPRAHYPLTRVSRAELKAARDRNPKLRGMPVVASVFGKHLELFPTPDKKYKVSETPKYLAAA
jgi:hypothetical protein